MHCSIKGVQVPVVILHALDDGIVPYELGRKVGYWTRCCCVLELDCLVLGMHWLFSFF